MNQPSPVVVAHRGLHQGCKENSRGAFIAAAEAGVPWIECDVWPSADDVVMIIHDEVVDRTTTGTGQVLRHTYAQLHELGIASLPEVINYFSGVYQGKPPALLVEIKPSDARFVGLVHRELSNCGLRWMVQSFHAENLCSAWAISPAIPAAFLVQTAGELYGAIESGWPMIHAHHDAVDQKAVDLVHQSGRQIGAWTVNAPKQIRRMIDVGIDMLITDEPVIAMRMVSDRQEPL